MMNEKRCKQKKRKLTIEMVEERSLTEGVLSFSGRVTEIVTELGTTDEVGISVGLVGNTRGV